MLASAEGGDNARFRGHSDEIAIAHQLRDGGGHFGRQAGRDPRQDGCVGCLGEQEFAEAADGETGERGESSRVMRIDDESRHLVLLIGDEMFRQKGFERQVGERHAGGDAARLTRRGEARQFVAGAARLPPAGRAGRGRHGVRRRRCGNRRSHAESSLSLL
jgi:hypothetical protein